MNKHLIIFVKNPELGTAKTRIAATTGDVRALEIYKELLEYTRDITSKVECHRHLFYSSDKIQHAFKQIRTEPARLIIIGSDCGELNTEIISQAFDSLVDHEVVLGPTFDGGYYLLGLQDPNLNLFSGIEWSTESVYPQTLEKVKAQNLSYFELPRLNDIDYEEDYLAWKAVKPKS